MSSLTSGERQLRWLTALSLAVTLLFLTVGPHESAAPPRSVRPTVAASAGSVPAQYRREPEQTYLTFPEWFLVFSPKEYANYVERQPPTDFPFLGHVAQFWFGYWHAYLASRDYPFNFDYHLMNWIIGTSTTVEYLVKAAYEETVGRLSALSASQNLSAEDQLGARVAADYARFIEVHAWYEFDYAAQLRQLWLGTPWLGRFPLRKLERRYFLTTEYAFKGVYGWAMNAAARASYAPESPVTAVLVRNFRPLPPAFPEVKPLDGKVPSGTTLLTVPRYQEFSRYAVELARTGADFVEIAGVRGNIVVTFIVPDESAPDPTSGRVLFTQHILTDPGHTRLVVEVPVTGLADLLRRFDRSELGPEHIFDY